MKKLSALLIACLIPACVSHPFQLSQAPLKQFSEFDYVRVDQFQIGELSHLPLSEQLSARELAALISRRLHLSLYRRGMFTAGSGDVLIITGKLVRFDVGEWTLGYNVGGEGTGSIAVEISFADAEGTVIASGTAAVGMTASAEGGSVSDSATALVSSVTKFVESNY